MALGVHFLEDVALISIGRWLPLPWWAVYAIGIGFSWMMLAGIIVNNGIILVDHANELKKEGKKAN